MRRAYPLRSPRLPNRLVSARSFFAKRARHGTRGETASGDPPGTWKPRRFGLPRQATRLHRDRSGARLRGYHEMSHGSTGLTEERLACLLGQERLSSYVASCANELPAAVALYRWNAAVSAALWQPLGHLEVALRNALSDALERRHLEHDRPGSWLDDPDGDLDTSAHRAIVVARKRVRRKGKRPSDGQTISEL